MDALRRVLGAGLGVVMLGIGIVFLLPGIASLLLGLYVLVVGEFHGRAASVIYIVFGLVFGVVGYGAIRLGWGALRQKNQTITSANDAT